MKKSLVMLSAMIVTFSVMSCAPQAETNQASEPMQNAMDELDPNSPDIEAKLAEMDKEYFEQTGESPFIESSSDVNALVSGCKREACPVYAHVKKSEQKMYLYINGVLTNTFLTSTGTSSHGTPDFEGNPNGRIYDKYTSTKYPGGDYNGLGNMPYAVFYKGGFAIHGTGKGNWKHLGRPASHGCVRVHPDNGFIFNRLVREHGIKSVWIRITK